MPVLLFFFFYFNVQLDFEVQRRFSIDAMYGKKKKKNTCKARLIGRYIVRFIEEPHPKPKSNIYLKIINI